MIFLPLKNSSLPLPVTLNLVDALEFAGGSVFKIAEQLTARELTFAETVKILHAAYAHARAGLSQGEVAEMFLSEGVEKATLLLTQIILSILAPAQEMGAVVRYGDSAGEVKARRRIK